MKVKEKSIKIITIGFLVIILLISGCTSEEKKPNENKEDSEEIVLTSPMYTDIATTSYTNDSLWNAYNVSSNLKRAFYVSDSPIQDIVDWYSEANNVVDWTIKRTGIKADPDDLTIIFGYVQIQKNETVEDETIGAYIFAKKIVEEMMLEGESLIGIAEGTWDLIIGCGEKTEE